MKWVLALTVAGLAASAAVAGPASAGVRTVAGIRSNVHIMPRNRVRSAAAPSAAASAAAARINFRYFGGPVMQAGTRTVPIFWEPPTLQDNSTPGALPTEYKTLIQGFLGRIGGHGLYNTVTQYYQLSSSKRQYIVNSSGMLQAVVDNTNPYPASAGACAANGLTNCVTDAQIQAEIASVIAAKSLPTDMSTVYVVFTASDELSCLDANTCFWPNDPNNTRWIYCAYHGMFTIAGQPVIYANLPYLETNYLSTLGCGGGVADPNADPAFDDESSVLSHEFMEAITDPDPSNPAWYDGNSGNENGDLCNARDTTVKWGSRRYVVQKEWSNATRSCVAGGNNALSLSPSTGVAGSSTRVSGTGFGKNELVRLYTNDAAGVATNLGSVRTDGSGAFHAAVSIRAGAPGGSVVVGATGATPGDGASAAFTAVGSSRFRPDLMVAPSKSGPRTGNNVYNLTGAGQIIMRTVRRAHSVAVWLVVQNDGNAPDTYSFRGPIEPTGYSFDYRVGPARVGRLFRAGTYRRILDPGESFLVQIVVRVRTSARIGSHFLAKIRVTSRGNVTKRDTVQVSVTAR